MNTEPTSRSDRRATVVLTGLIALLAIGLVFHQPDRVRFSPFPADSLTDRDAVYAARRDSFARLKEQRETARQLRELRYQAIRDSFAQLKRMREMARAEREALWEHRRDSFARLKAERQEARRLREEAYQQREAVWQHRRDSIRKLRPDKLEEGEFIWLNQADTTLLMRIPGIGTALSQAITAYRYSLGGFITPDQVLEVNGVPASVLPYLRVKDPNEVERLRINRLSVEKLRKHPYLNFYQAQAIAEYRRKYGPLKSIRQLSLLREFTEADFNRLEPYLRYD